MACMRCGSAWVTKKGKDMASCPECCKQQRCKARKQGLLPPAVQKACKRCGLVFEVTGSGIAKRVYCESCCVEARAEWRAEYRAAVANGERTPVARPTHVERACGWCNKNLKEGRRKYCGRDCFVAARNAGVQFWDRTRQIEGNWHRGGLWANAPSKKIVAKMQRDFKRLVHDMQTFMYRAFYSKPRCKNCDAVIKNGRKNFCSDECWKTCVTEVPCRKCGSPAMAPKGRTKATCLLCVKSMRRMRGNTHRRRARHHGVKYVSFPVRAIYERDGYKCQICCRPVLLKVAYRKRDGKIHPRSPSIDHIIPMCRGGNHEPANCQTACFMCNSKKGGRAIGQLRLPGEELNEFLGDGRAINRLKKGV